MKYTIALCMGIFAVAAIAGCGSIQKEQKNINQQITPAKAKSRMDAGGVTVVDVRTAEEYKEGHIPGAILVPNEEIGSEAPPLLADKEATLLVYCRSGIRSKEAAEKLANLGYVNVYEFGGILDWKYEIVK